MLNQSDAYWLVQRAQCDIEDANTKQFTNYVSMVAHCIAATGEYNMEYLTRHKSIPASTRNTIRRLRKMGFVVTILSIKRVHGPVSVSMTEFKVRVTLPKPDYTSGDFNG